MKKLLIEDFYRLSEYSYYRSPSLTNEEDEDINNEEGGNDDELDDSNIDTEDEMGLEDDINDVEDEQTSDVEIVDKTGKEVQVDVTDLVQMNKDILSRLDSIMSYENEEERKNSDLENEISSLKTDIFKSFDNLNKKIDSFSSKMEQEFIKRVPTKEEQLYQRMDRNKYAVKLTDYFDNMKTKDNSGNYLTLSDIENYDESFIKKSLS